MSDNLDSLFTYLGKENIYLDKAEFLFQYKAHPDYPSLLSISDTLNFFSIGNHAFDVDFLDFDLLPNRFSAFLREENASPELCVIEKKNGKHFVTKNTKTAEVDKSTLEAQWLKIVLFIEEQNNIAVNQTKNIANKVLGAISILLFVFLFMNLRGDWQSKGFILFPILGILFSFIALKDLFRTSNETFNSLCNISASTSCSAVISSEKWLIFKWINYSNLSIIFFVTQFITLLVSLHFGYNFVYFSLTKIILLSSIPFVMLSIYFQKFVVKKWCPICLMIIGLFVIEFVYIQVLSPKYNFDGSLAYYITLVLIFTSVVFLWNVVKGILVKQNELIDFKIKGIRFIRNYTNFKNTVLSGIKHTMLKNPIQFGNAEATTTLTMTINPFCGHCKDANELMKKILLNNSNSISINYVFNIGTEILLAEENKKRLFRNLIALYLSKGEMVFLNALTEWYQNLDSEKWNAKYQIAYNNEKIDSILTSHYEWCTDNGHYFTPMIFINGYLFPKSFEKQNLEFYIKDIIEDEELG